MLLHSRVEQAMVDSVPSCTLRAGESSPVFLVLDFGREYYGGIRIITGRNSEKRGFPLRIRFGESLSEAINPHRGTSADTYSNEHGIHETVIDLPWLGSMEFGATGFRYLYMESVLPGSVEIVSLHACSLLRPYRQVGSFSCSDELLTRIWDTAARTTHLCMQEYLWDGIKRDRLVWGGDLHPEVMTTGYLFGAVDVVNKSLDFLRDNTPPPKWMNGISAYTLWWIICWRDWYLFTADRARLAEQEGYLLSLLDHMKPWVGKGGRERLPQTRFLDWSSFDDEETIHCGLQGLLSMALHALAYLLKELGRSKESEKTLTLARAVASYRPSFPRRKQAGALAVLGGLFSPQEIDASLFRIAPCRGFSPFSGYYLLEAKAMAGDLAGALAIIRGYWGAMLAAGATTFWESFDPAWTEEAGGIDTFPQPGRKDLHADFGEHCYQGYRHSLCHGWSSGPAAWLSEHILGVTPLTPGFRQALLCPALPGLTWAEGCVPTPAGPVRVRHEVRSDGSVASQADVPEGIELLSPNNSGKILNDHRAFMP